MSPKEKRYWKVYISDGSHTYIGYGETYEDVWEQVANVENFDIDLTECHIYERMAHAPLSPRADRPVTYTWEERYVMDVDDPCLVVRMTANNSDEGDI